VCCAVFGSLPLNPTLPYTPSLFSPFCLPSLSSSLATLFGDNGVSQDTMFHKFKEALSSFRSTVENTLSAFCLPLFGCLMLPHSLPHQFPSLSPLFPCLSFHLPLELSAASFLLASFYVCFVLRPIRLDASWFNSNFSLPRLVAHKLPRLGLFITNIKLVIIIIIIIIFVCSTTVNKTININIIYI